MKKLLASLLLLSGWFGASVAGTLVDVQILDRNSGQVLEIYRHHGRLYVAGAPGNRYAVRLANRADGRVLTVVSVDGVNAISGQTAAASQTGYVLTSGQSAEIAGWRKNMDEVAAFYFTSIADSYAGRTGRPQNVGVIGVAVFREAAPPRPITPPVVYEQRGTDNGAAGAADKAESSALRRPMAAPAAPGLGTGHGERLAARSEYTDFRRASDRPVETITIYYDSYANLVARGIVSSGAAYGRPNPFPGGFVPDPRS
ncbi:MAG: hypothetical protein ACM3SV_09375 [Betaproteobacteria bacterium]